MPQRSEPYRILIIDDSPDDQAALQRLLNRAPRGSFEVEGVRTGEAGLAALRESRFDCVLLDNQLPDTDGTEFLRELAGPGLEPLPVAVILLTGQGHETLAVEAFKRGVQDYLVKGRFSSEVLRQRITDAIEQVATRRELARLHQEAREAIRQKDEALARQAATEAQLREQLSLVETLAQTTTEGLCMVDGAGRFTFVNPAAAALFGSDPPHLLNTTLVDLLASLGEVRAVRGPALMSVIGSGSTVRDALASWPASPGAAVILVGFSAAPVLVDGQRVGTVLALRDVTEQGRIDEESSRLAAELVDAGRRKDEFLAILAHELRNPLAPILNAMRIIGLRGDSDPAQVRLQAMVEQQVRHMGRLIDDLLDMSRIARGTIQLRREPTVLGDAVERAVDAIRHQMDARGQILEIHLDDRAAVLDADPTRLDQILSNLLTNAARYTDPNGLIRLTSQTADGFSEIRVADNGVGIAPDFLPKIFELFAQANPSLDRSRGGLGIGLTLVRDLVELHGGTIGVASAGLGQGSTFLVRLPTVPAAAHDQPTQLPTLVAGPSLPVRPVRVLVVDDNVHAAQSLAVILGLWGHHVEVAHDGTSAFNLARGTQPEVILLDIGLPEIDGYQVARRIRTDLEIQPVAILAMTGYASPDDYERSREEGFDGHLVKPVDLDHLEQFLGTLNAPVADPVR